MPSLSEVKSFRQERFAQSMALIDKKGADYNRDQQEQGDTLFNLKVCEILGIVPSMENGILVRLSDKFMRLISLTKPGREAAVKDESVLDTINDIHNYVDYLGLIWLQRRMENAYQSQPVELKRNALFSSVPMDPCEPTGGYAGPSLNSAKDVAREVRHIVCMCPMCNEENAVRRNRGY